MSIEVTMRHSDVRIEAMKEYAQQRMEKLCAAYPKVTKVTCVIDIDVIGQGALSGELRNQGHHRA